MILLYVSLNGGSHSTDAKSRQRLTAFVEEFPGTFWKVIGPQFGIHFRLILWIAARIFASSFSFA